jgi:hypothetical protein
VCVYRLRSRRSPAYGLNMSSTDVLDVLAATCEEQAHLFLESPRADLDSEAALASSRPYAVDRRGWIENHGDQDPAGWLSQVVTMYLAEASHQLDLLGSLVRSRAVHATLEPLVRAVLERSGRICWLLDPTASAQQRAARCQLEVGVCALHYADALNLLDADADVRDELRTFRGEQRTRVHSRHAVDKNDAKNDMSDWIVDGENYPNFTDSVSYALSDHPLSPGMYAGLSGFAHPNVFFAGERRNQTVVTPNVLIMHTDSIERTLRIAIGSHNAALKRWASYYFDIELATELVAELGRLADVLDAASVLEPELDSGSSSPTATDADA